MNYCEFLNTKKNVYIAHSTYISKMYTQPLFETFHDLRSVECDKLKAFLRLMGHCHFQFPAVAQIHILIMCFRDLSFKHVSELDDSFKIRQRKHI
jgi:hypothetical protein